MSQPQYSPTLRTAVVLTGTGTAGAYHAGVLRALHEAGVRVDLVAGRGVGAIGAMFAAIDGGHRLWDADGFWRAPAARRFYSWTRRLRIAGWAVAVAAACLALPVAVLLGIALLSLAGWMLALAGATTLSTTTSRTAASLLDALFNPVALPTVVPRLAMLAMMAAVAILAVTAWQRHRQGSRHVAPGWASLLGAPLEAASPIAATTTALWELIRGAAPLPSPTSREISRKYAEMLAENVGQPGFRELLLVAHDLDARRDVSFSLLGEPYRGRVFGRRGDADRRDADAIDLAGAGRDHVLDALAGALSLPLGTDPHVMTFAPEAYWRGESHRLVDRPSSCVRLLEEVSQAGAEQVILVSAAAALEGPHALAPARGDGRGRAGELIAAVEAASVRDAHAAAAALGLFTGGVYQIRPAHNPLGPLDFGGTYDARSDRQQSVAELLDRGYEDAYRQFIEPVVGQV